MKNKIKLLMLLSISLIMTSCSYDKLPDESYLPLPQNVSFQTDIQPIFNQNCIACHNGTQSPDLRDGSSYNALMSLPAGSIIPGNADGSELIGMLKNEVGTDNPMPPSSPMATTKINFFISWINEGALNN